MALDDLPRIGTTSYGDGPDRFDFNGSTETVDFRVTPVRDEASRTVTASKVALTLRTYESGTQTSRNVRRAIAILQKDGLPLRYRGRPFGDWDINTPGGKLDVAFGPKVGEVKCRPAGGTRTVEITWSVEFTVPTCADAVFTREIMEFNWQADFSRAPNGDTTRTVSGYLRIPNNRLVAGKRVIRDSADLYLEDVTPALVTGFRRESVDRTVSRDKCRLDFKFVDVQMSPNAPPPGVTLCTASHNYASEGGPAGVAAWQGTVEAEYELLRGQAPFAAIVAFMGLFADRTAAIRTVRSGAGIDGAPVGDLMIPIPLRTEVSEPTIYGPGNQRVRMSISYRLGGIGLPAVIASGGLWRAVPGSNWNLWSASIATALGPRGTANIRVNTNEDAIVDLCGKSTPVTPDAPPPRAV